mgnify:CR=1 FL=1
MSFENPGNYLITIKSMWDGFLDLTKRGLSDFTVNNLILNMFHKLKATIYLTIVCLLYSYYTIWIYFIV